MWEEPRRRPSQLASMIEQATQPYRPSPDLSLNLEICDHINQKKANTPREAAVEILRHVNGRNTHSAMLALNLLDNCVKNCGYPFHLQVSTKEFLNELILELIHEWKATICVTSKHRDDLVHIRDMHRLLSYKGYRFPDFDRRSAAVLNPQDSIRSAEEMEEEDRAAQAAKLQELIRRGGPKDLAAAQELMKIMAGAEPDRKPDYGKQSQKDMNIIRQRVLLLNEMLNNAKPNERFVEGDAYDQIAQKCRTVRAKLQRLITDLDEHDAEQADDLLALNDLINAVLTRYEAFQAGDRSAVADIAVGSNGSSQTKSKGAETSLIDFEDPASAEPAVSIQDSLADLSLGPTPPGPLSRPHAPSLPNDLFAGLGQANGATLALPGTIRLDSNPSTPLSGSRPMSSASTQVNQRPMNPAGRPVGQQAGSAGAAAGSAKRDPFADLVDLF